MSRRLGRLEQVCAVSESHRQDAESSRLLVRALDQLNVAEVIQGGDMEGPHLADLGLCYVVGGYEGRDESQLVVLMVHTSDHGTQPIQTVNTVDIQEKRWMVETSSAAGANQQQMLPPQKH